MRVTTDGGFRERTIVIENQDELNAIIALAKEGLNPRLGVSWAEPNLSIYRSLHYELEHS